MKLPIVRAGSTYTPELVDWLVRLQGLLPVDELALVDIAAARLDVLAGLVAAGGGPE